MATATDARFGGPTPFARLAIAHAASMCGDVCLTVSLAGSLFFSISPGESRPKVLLYLALTMAPFAVIAPLLGPLLDRTRGGRRLMVFVTAVARATLVLFMARYINRPVPEGLLIYPLAFGMLVMSKTYSISKSALVPAVVKDKASLVSANSRLAIISVIAGAVGGLPAAGVYKLAGAEWSLLLAALVFVAAALLAWQIPRAETTAAPRTRLEQDELHAPSIQFAAGAMGLLRGGVGFLTFFVAFALRESGKSAFVFGVVLVASGVGSFLGNVVAPPLRKITREEMILAGSLIVPGVACLFAARSADVAWFTLGAFVVALGAAAGRVAFDSLLQRDAPEAVRGRSFARFETRFQLTWVIGALIPVAIPLSERVGLFILAIVLGFTGISYLGGLRAARERLEQRRQRIDRARALMRDGLRSGVDRMRRSADRRRTARHRSRTAREREDASGREPTPAATPGEPPEPFPGGS